MFSPNYVIALANPEITIKSSIVRGKLIKRLESNIIFYLRLKKVSYSKVFCSAGRFFIETNEPQKVVSALEHCFGIHFFYLAQKFPSKSVADVCLPLKDICGTNLKNNFAVRGKSHCLDYSSKDLEIALGSEVLNCFPELKVKLKYPDSELFCLSFEDCSYFYFKEIIGPGGMPVGSQGKVALIVSTNNADELALSLMKSGCSLVVFGKLAKKTLKFSPASILFVDLSKIKSNYALGNVEAVFSDLSSMKEVSVLSKKLGLKVFAPFIF